MGLREFEETEIRSAVMGVEVTIIQSYITQSSHEFPQAYFVLYVPDHDLDSGKYQ